MCVASWISWMRTVLVSGWTAAGRWTLPWLPVEASRRPRHRYRGARCAGGRRGSPKSPVCPVPRPDTRAWNFVLGDDAGHQIDFHVIMLDEHGRGVYGPSENGEYYPSEALTGKGTVNGRTVNCITPFSGWCNSTPATGSWPAPHFSDDRRASVHDRSEERRHRPDETLDLALAKTVAEVPHPLRVGLHPERPVRVAPHLGHVWVAQGGKRRGAELAAELGI